MAAAVAAPMDGQRQLERASRLLDAGLGLPQGKCTPVRKALEQHFSEARSRAQAGGALLGGPLAGATSPFGFSSAVAGAGASRLLQSPAAQRLEREVADFALGAPAATSTLAVGGASSSAAAATGTAGGLGLGGGAGLAEQPMVGVREFFAMQHERVLLGAVEEAHRDCMQSLERHAFGRIQADWEEAKAQIVSAMAPHRLGAAPIGSALRGVPGGPSSGVGVGGASGLVLAAPPQDAAVIQLLLAEPVSSTLVQRIGQLSSESCPPYRGELQECWSIVSHQLEPSVRAVMRGSLRYLQSRFAAEARQVVYSSAERLGGMPDAWSLVKALGRIRFGAPNFPATPVHVWYAAFAAARAGFGELLGELPERAAPCSDRCPLLRTVCSLLAARLGAASARGQPAEFAVATGADAADLLRADRSEEGNSFHDILVALLLGRSFAFGRFAECTVEDWLWFRLHSLCNIVANNDKAPEFIQELDALRRQVVALPSSHYDPSVGASGSGGFLGSGGATAPGGAAQTLNFVKVLLLTGQFGRAVQQLKSQDPCLNGPAMHLALVLHRSGTLGALAAPEEPVSIAGLICDYVGNFGCGDQLQYFRVLPLEERVRALQRLLLRGGAGTNDDLLGFIDGNGRHRAGLLERSLQEDGCGDGAEFAALCARTGRSAAEHGQYREAFRLLHLGRCHSEVLALLCRCLRLPIWRDPSSAASEEAQLLGQDVQRFFSIYERNLDRYAVAPQAWSIARKLYASRMFHELCDHGQPEAALDIFDREQLLPLAPEQRGPEAADTAAELLAEQPRIVSDYVQILRHAALQGVVVAAALRARVQQLLNFLASQAHRLQLDQATAAALANLSLC
eukprot:TRINITY_DN15540_c0_g2_i1.p1 TRINITY_DN15540_c0_g2~~TRINITY_DN15540_c0_g2_i1.p1  ORF type:complete len:852 (+),score=231.62 TRINITY_DN15540_c0_g2_i1:72-2627(+)